MSDNPKLRSYALRIEHNGWVDNILFEGASGPEAEQQFAALVKTTNTDKQGLDWSGYRTWVLTLFESAGFHQIRK